MGQVRQFDVSVSHLCHSWVQGELQAGLFEDQDAASVPAEPKTPALLGLLRLS